MPKKTLREKQLAESRRIAAALEELKTPSFAPKLTTQKRGGLSRSSLEFYFGLFVAIVLWRFPMTMPLQLGVLFLIAAMGCDICWNSALTISWTIRCKIILCTLFVAILGYYIQYLPKITTPEILLKAQIGEIQQLQEFIGGKEELELQEVFDFHAMAQINLLMAKSIIAPGALTQEQMNEINVSVKNGNLFGDQNYLVESPLPYHFKPKPRTIPEIILTNKYLASMEVLSKYESAPEMPQSIRLRIAEFRKTVERDAYLLLYVLNDKLSDDPQNIILEDDFSTKYGGAVVNAYAGKFIPLKPKEDALSKEISSYLGTQ